MIRCVIIEDQAPAQRVLKKYIADYGQIDLIETFTNVPEALNFLEQHPVDLLFLDIHLPQVSGMDFLRNTSLSYHVILTTAFSDYALEGYEHGVIDYLLKPFSYERFLKAIERIPSPESKLGIECILKSGHEYIRFNSDDVMYIRTDMDYTEIHLADKKHLSKETLAHWEQELTPYGFVRVHRSFLVNLSKVERLNSSTIYLSDERTVPIGRAFKEQVMFRWTNRQNH